MFIKRYGQGARAFFGLHGWSGDHRTFEPLVEFLPRDATLYSADLPGCGNSPAIEDLNPESLAAEIAKAVQAIDAPRVTFIGNCSGAILGLSAMSRIAERIDRLALIDPFAYAPWYFRVFVSRRIGKYAYYSTFANPIGRWIANLSLRKHRAEETHLTESFGRVDHAVSLRYLQLMIAIDGIDQWRWIGHPIDIVYGERSFGAVRTSVAMWQVLWPRARVFELKGAGHLPIQEATRELSRIVFEPSTV